MNFDKRRDIDILDWMFGSEDKMKQFHDIKQAMREHYLNDPMPWIVAVSFGKDSATLLELVITMLKELSPSEINKKVYVITANTKVETPIMTNYVKRNLELLQAEKFTRLGIEVIEVKPSMKNSFYYNVIGKGLGAPNGKSKFTWCQHKLKLGPQEEVIQYVLANRPFDFDLESLAHKATILIGTRDDESIRRAASIAKHQETDFFGKHAYHSSIRTYMPLRYVSTADIWYYLDFAVGVFTWGMEVSALREHYEDGKECPVIRSTKDKACGGSSRNGCYTCQMSGRKDSMLEALINKGHKDMEPLYEFKKFLFDVSNDIRYREILRRKELTKTLNNNQLTFLDYTDSNEEEPLLLAHKGDKNGEYRPGGFSVSARKMILEKLLAVEQKSGHKLIDEEEIRAILEAWKEDGLIVDEVLPVDHVLDSNRVELKPDWSINEKESQFTSPMFEVKYKFRYDADELAKYFKERQTYTQEHIFCYFDHEKVEEKGFVYNTMSFFVIHPEIWTQEEADAYVADFLFIKGEERKDAKGKPFIKMTKDARKAALHSLMVDALAEGLKQNIAHKQKRELVTI